MKPLIKFIFFMWIAFTSILIIANFTGLLSLENIKSGLESMMSISPYIVGLAVMSLLIIDLFFAIPTLSLCLLAGFLIGFPLAFLFTTIGMTLAGLLGYLASRKFGDKVVQLVIKDKSERADLKVTFKTYGFYMIVLSRAAPLLAEITACLSGVTRMRFGKFIVAWLLSAVPYAGISTYFGSISTLDNPFPAIIAAICLNLALSLAWFLSKKKMKKAYVN